MIRQLLDAVADTMTRPPETARHRHRSVTRDRQRRPLDDPTTRGPRPARPGPARAAGRGARGGARGRRRGRRAPGPRRGRRHPLRRRRPALAGRRRGPRLLPARAAQRWAGRCAGPRRPGRRSTGCSGSRCPTGWCSTPTSWPTCSSTVSRRSTPSASTCSGRAGCAASWSRRPGSRSTPAPREGQLMEGLFGPDALFSFDWRLALGSRPADRRRDGRAGRGHVAGDQAARQLDGDRPGRRAPRPASARRPSRSSRSWRCRPRSPASSTSTAAPSRCTPARPWRRCATASSTPPWSRPLDDTGGARRAAARLPAPRPDLAGRAHRRRARRLPGRRHGPGQDDHPDRPAPAPPGPRAGHRTRRSWSARRA